MRNLLIIINFLLACYAASSQRVTGTKNLPQFRPAGSGVLRDPLNAAFSRLPADSAKLFSLRDFQQQVLNNHPIIRQAALLSKEARAEVLQSLGKFDPILESAFDRKEFGNTDYYSNWANQLKVPLWLAGADLKIGYDRFIGENVNPQCITPGQGLSGVGLSVPLGQGFVIDARRNVLNRAGSWFDMPRPSR